MEYIFLVGLIGRANTYQSITIFLDLYTRTDSQEADSPKVSFSVSTFLN